VRVLITTLPAIQKYAAAEEVKQEAAVVRLLDATNETQFEEQNTVNILQNTL
jgi:hypothetical protein